MKRKVLIVFDDMIQGFIPALFLTYIFHKGLSFMALGHNPTCFSTLASSSWGFTWDAGNLPCGVQRQCPWKL